MVVVCRAVTKNSQAAQQRRARSRSHVENDTALEMDQTPLHLIANMAAGQGMGQQVADIAATQCRAAGRPLVLYSPRSPKELPRMGERALQSVRSEGGIVLAAGGDGTVRTMVQILAGTDVPLAVVPTGTFNYFARNHGIPEDLGEAVQIALSGVPEPVTLGEVNGEFFLINASLGLYARVIQERESRISRFGRNRLLAIASTATSLIGGHRPLRLELSVDGESRQLRTPMVFVGSNALQLRHVALDVARCAQQGQLAVVVLKPVGRWELTRMTVRGLLRKLQDEESLTSFCADTVEVRRHRRRLAVALDGEVLRISPPLRFRSRRDAVLLVKPKHPPPATAGA